MKAVTSANARDRLKEIEVELRAASNAYDALLVTGDDVEIAVAEETITRLRATHARLSRQAGVLQTAEAAAEKARAQRAREEAEKELAAARAQASAAISAFMEAFRDQLLELHALAHEQLAAPLRALEVAREHADRLHGRTRAFIPEKELMLDGYEVPRAWLSRRAREQFGGQEPLMDHKHEMNIFGFLERFAHAIETEESEPRSAA